jgi:cyclase
MLARRLIPCLNLAAYGPPGGSAWVQHLVSAARRLEDDGADELLLSAEGLLPAATQPTVEAIAAIAAQSSIALLASGARSFDELELMVRAGVGAVVVEGAVAGLVKRCVAAWGSELVAASVQCEHGADPIAGALLAAQDGARELLVRGPSEPSQLRAISQATRVPIIAAGELQTLEEARQQLVDGRVDAVVLSEALLHSCQGISEAKRYLAAAGVVVRGVS